MAALEEEKEGFQDTAENDFERDQIMSELAVPIFGDTTEMDIISAILSLLQPSNSSEVNGAESVEPTPVGGAEPPQPSEACTKDVEKFVEDLLASKEYALRSK